MCRHATSAIVTLVAYLPFGPVDQGRSSLMKRITSADINQICANGYDRPTIAEAEAWLDKCRRADELIDLVRHVFANVEL
ncbi:MAG: hypothetical protein R3C17_20005 [Planctomycetaceae bacterium]